MTLEERFWAKVDQSGDCWEWTAARDIGGYGVIGIERVPRKAHRLAWVIANGPIPDGMWVLHHCDNRGCVRVSHLFLGTARDNVLDMDRKGRRGRGYRMSRRGEKHQAAKLSDETVAAIRVLRAQGWTERRIGKQFGLSHTYVGVLARGEMRSG